MHIRDLSVSSTGTDDGILMDPNSKKIEPAVGADPKLRRSMAKPIRETKPKSQQEIFFHYVYIIYL